jgi:hypothetical protein
MVLDFAGHLRGLFAVRFASDRLTISAGVALIKPNTTAQGQFLTFPQEESSAWRWCERLAAALRRCR